LRTCVPATRYTRMFDLKHYLKVRREAVNTALAAAMPRAGEQPALLHKAMRYCVFPGGKRIRPIICMAAAEAVGGKAGDALPAAAAIELCHTYTLIHDDLPCMDDDDLRRGRPTCHVVFGEANAVLAGDALQALSFEVVARTKVPKRYLPNQLVLELAVAAGSRGVVGGQVEDMAFDPVKSRSRRRMVVFIHLHKTADLFRAAARMGGIAANATRRQLAALTEYGVNLGMAFQITDDLLDEAAASAKAKKRKGKAGDMNCVSIYGRTAARDEARKHVKAAIAAVRRLRGNGVEPLVSIATSMVERSH
jgi:geranylgeranyl diphosphate synthase, type II